MEVRLRVEDWDVEPVLAAEELDARQEDATFEALDVQVPEEADARSVEAVQ